MIDIIIPAYNAHSTIEYTLMSIAMQTIKDKVKVYIVDDYSKEDYNSIINRFNKELDISILKLDKNSGTGIARQYGLDNSNGEYIYFLDADDVFINPESLESLYNNINNYDLIYGYVYNEYLDINNINLGDLHGKLYSRNFIDKHNIRFNDSRYHEDNAFNSLILLHNPNIKKLDNLILFYSFNKNSITRDSEENQFNRLEIYIDNMNYVLSISKDCSKYLIKDYIKTKYTYLIKQYELADNNQKEKLKDWLHKYDFSYYINLLDKEDIDIIKNTIGLQ